MGDSAAIADASMTFTSTLSCQQYVCVPGMAVGAVIGVTHVAPFMVSLTNCLILQWCTSLYLFNAFCVELL